MGHPKVCTDAAHRARLVRGLGPQAVIHRHRARGDPRLGREMQQRHGIAAPRNGEAQGPRLAQPRAPQEPLAQRHQLQPSPCMVVAASAADGLPGKRVPTSASVTQASGVWRRSPSARPSFSSASGARGPSGSPEKLSR